MKLPQLAHVVVIVPKVLVRDKNPQNYEEHGVTLGTCGGDCTIDTGTRQTHKTMKNMALGTCGGD